MASRPCGWIHHKCWERPSRAALPEFPRNVLEVMRQPLEDGHVTIARAAMSLTFPARFMLAAAMNPCPCGYHGSGQRECHCTKPMIERYVSKISGPLMDRIDI